MSVAGNRRSGRSQSIGTLLENLVEHCQSHAISEKGLREIIGLHGDHSIVNDYQFFHLACRNEAATERILRYLLRYFPNAARYADAHAFIPLHRLCENKNATLNMVQLLIDAFRTVSVKKILKGACLFMNSVATKTWMKKTGWKY
jgi:hypothetical protein